MAGRYPACAAYMRFLLFFLLANKWYSLVLKHLVLMLKPLLYGLKSFCLLAL